MDLRKPVKPEEQVASADTWYELAGKEGASARKNLQLRAAHWYWLAFPDMKGGLEKVRVEKRMKGLAPLVASLPAPRQVVNKIDGSVLVLIPAGRFLFGEKKMPVELSAFYLGMYKVTNVAVQEVRGRDGTPSIASLGRNDRACRHGGPTGRPRQLARRCGVLPVGGTAAADRAGVGEGRTGHGWSALPLG